MKLSTKCRYGARAMVQLGLAHQSGAVTVKEMARREEIPPKYLEKLIAALKTAGLVLSARGPQGGYVLARPPSEIKLTEIVGALQGPLFLVDCVNYPEVCRRREVCVTHDVWKQMCDAMVKVLSSLSLEDLAERRREKEESSGATSGA